MIPPPEEVEVKLAFRPEDTAAAEARLDLNDPSHEERRIFFFDTAALAFFQRGLMLRARQTVLGDVPDDFTLKVRGPGAPDAASRFLAASGGGAKYEGDQTVGGENVPSFSLTTQPAAAVVAQMVADPRTVASALTSAGQTLLQEIGGAEDDSDRRKALGPIRARVWKLKPPGFASKISAELWEVAGTRLLEISDKVSAAEALQFATQLQQLVPKEAARQLPTSKTRFALNLLCPPGA